MRAFILSRSHRCMAPFAITASAVAAAALLLVLLFVPPEAAPTPAAPIQLASPNEIQNGWFGCSIAAVPAVAGGKKTSNVVVGACREHGLGGLVETGRAYVFAGATGSVLLPLSSPNEEAFGRFGSAVAGVPDISGDGMGDVIVGAMWENPAASPAGRVYVFDGVTGALLLSLVSPNAIQSGRFGVAVAGVPDVNGDGRGDVLVGAAGEKSPSGPDGAGRAYLFDGATGVLLHAFASPNETLTGAFGQAVAGVPDLDGDGRGDIVIGAPREGASFSGRAYIFSGAGGTLLRTLLPPAPQATGDFGAAVSGVDDLNGDARGDVIIGAPGETSLPSAPNAGRAHVFNGGSGALLRTLAPPFPQNGARFGVSVSGVPDVTRDERGDIVVGAYAETTSPTRPNAGRALLFDGASGMLFGALVSPNEEASGSFAGCVAGLADVDGDGLGGVAIGAYREDPGASPEDAGRAYTFAVAPPPIVSGRIQSQFGVFLPGIPVNASNGARSDATDASGAYRVLVYPSWSGAITPTALGYSFEPTSHTFVSVTSDLANQNFTATTPSTILISGHAKRGDGSPLHGIVVVASDGTSTSTTDAAGAYALDVPYGWFGSVTPTSPALSFLPETRTYSKVVFYQQNQDFTASPVFKQITGAVRGPAGSPLANVTVTGSNGGGSNVTNALGLYSLSVPYGWSGTTTPTLSGHYFDPVNRTYSGVVSDQSAQDFTAFPFLTISGYLKDIDGRAVATSPVLTSLPDLSTTTDLNGFYSLTVNYGWTGWVAPRAFALKETIYDYTPAYRSYSNLAANRASQNFILVRDSKGLYDVSSLMPPVADQRATSVTQYAPPDFSLGYGAGVCWAMGYYYKTFQEAKEHGWSRLQMQSDAARRISPYFLYNNGGLGFAHFSGEIITGHGVCTMSDYASYDTVTTTSHLEEAAQFKAVGYSSFFVHKPTTTDTLEFTSSFENTTTTLRSWLKGGDAFVLAIPVFDSFLAYRSGVYEVANARLEILRGYHAVCVVGFDRKLAAFKVVNSWGDGWGIGGYAWISAGFVERYGLEAWRMFDSTGFDLDPGVTASSTARRQVQYSKDYKIVYTTRENGQMSVTTAGVTIAGGGARDTLSIARRPGVVRGETVPRVASTGSAGSFARIYSEAPIGAIDVAGSLESLTMSYCHATAISAQTVGSVRMNPATNATWVDLASRLRKPDFRLPNYAFTAIECLAPTPPDGQRLLNANIQLSGIRTDTIIVPDRVLSISVASKKQTPPTKRAFVSVGAIERNIATADAATIGAANGATSATGGLISAATLRRVKAAGTGIASGLIADFLPSNRQASVASSGAVFSSSFQGKTILFPYDGDLDANRIYLSSRRASVAASGGNIEVGDLIASGEITNLSARFLVYRDTQPNRQFVGGRLGFHATDPAASILGGVMADDGATTMIVASGASSDYPAKIRSIYGDLGVRGIFYAGAVNGSSGAVSPNCRDKILKIATRKPNDPLLPPDVKNAGGPFIMGEGWVQTGTTIKFKGDEFAETSGRFLVRHCE